MFSLIILTVAVIFEVLGTICMKLSNGFSVLWASLAMVIFYIISFVFFVYSIRQMQISVAYAIWTALGMFAINISGIVLFGEELSLFKFVCLGIVVVGVIGLSFEVDTQS